MIWLQSNERYDTLAQYDPEQGVFSIKTKTESGDQVTEKTDGFFSVLSDVFVALYRSEHALFLCVGDQRIVLTDDLRINVSGGADQRQLIVKKHSTIITQLTYCLDEEENLADDPTPFIEDEDFDFGLFVANVANNHKRKQVFLGLA